MTAILTDKLKIILLKTQSVSIQRHFNKTMTSQLNFL